MKRQKWCKLFNIQSGERKNGLSISIGLSCHLTKNEISVFCHNADDPGRKDAQAPFVTNARGFSIFVNLVTLMHPAVEIRFDFSNLYFPFLNHKNFIF